ncbi:MAG: YdeI/OmpD-associated family protein [Candidatus Saccharibacteria bacterium]|nr:MAG: YdeI/OmpD-associated family protein [Candidatus Saccharibacteria bacterium]
MDKQSHDKSILFSTDKDWEIWLSQHHAQVDGVWMKVAKKGAEAKSIAIGDALDIALCYGWIDGQRRAYDDTYYLQKYTPRRPKSLWSKVNIAKVEALIAGGRMQKPGFEAIEAAKADGRWQAAYASQRTATMPPELEAALKRSPKAKAFYDTLNKTNKYAVIWRLLTAKTEKTKSARLQKMIDMLEDGKAFH